MADRARHLTRRPVLWIVLLMAVVIVVGALHWFRPFLAQEELAATSVPAPPALSVLDYFTLAPGQKACMGEVTITSNSGLAEFIAQPARTGSKATQRIELALSGVGYKSTAAGSAPPARTVLQLPITPPPHDTVGTICFTNRGRAATSLDGTNEPRSVTRSPLVVAGTPEVGEITLTFREAKASSLSDRLGEVFEHASNLTDDLVPVWLIWLIALLTCVGIPIALVAAFYLALAEDELTR